MISLTILSPPRIEFQRNASLFIKKVTLCVVSKLTGVPVSSIFDELKRQKVKLRSANDRRKTNPPFGYAYLKGQLVINPTEYKTVQIILDLSESGMRPYHIEKYLNDKQIPTRKGGRWFSRIVTNIIDKERTGFKQ
jgi:hypothetical protein